jgi:hypothetical protein
MLLTPGSLVRCGSELCIVVETRGIWTTIRQPNGLQCDRLTDTLLLARTVVPAGHADRWQVVIEDDGVSGFSWFAYRLGVEQSRGWFRSRDLKLVILWARQTALGFHGSQGLEAAA